jgi:filamentous hemagglutinin family protein
MQEHVYYTNYRCFTYHQAEQYLRYKVSFGNWGILLKRLCTPESASNIEGFTEVNGQLFFINKGKRYPSKYPFKL